jgi:hypothetical protein
VAIVPFVANTFWCAHKNGLRSINSSRGVSPSGFAAGIPVAIAAAGTLRHCVAQALARGKYKEPIALTLASSLCHLW